MICDLIPPAWGELPACFVLGRGVRPDRRAPLRRLVRRVERFRQLEPTRLPAAVGYAMPWHVPVPRDDGAWLFTPRALDGCFSGASVGLFFLHEERRPLCSTGVGSLALAADDLGLAFACVLPDMPLGRRMHDGITHGMLGASLGFSTRGYTSHPGLSAGGPLNVVHSAVVREISLTQTPALKAAYVKVAGANLSPAWDRSAIDREADELERLSLAWSEKPLVRQVEHAETISKLARLRVRARLAYV